MTDYRGLNRYLECLTHPFLTTEVLSKMVRADSRFFAKVDLFSAYNQVPLAEESQLLTTFLISAGKMSGRYAYQRAAMGMSPSGDWTCHWADIALEGLLGTYISVDDILLQGRTMKELEARLEALLTNLEKHIIMESEKKLIVKVW